MISSPRARWRMLSRRTLAAPATTAPATTAPALLGAVALAGAVASPRAEPGHLLGPRARA